MSLLIHILMRFQLSKCFLSRELLSEDDHRSLMAMKMNAKFDKYCDFEKLNPIFFASVVLDPRSKLDYLEVWFHKLLDSYNTPNFFLNIRSRIIYISL